MDGKTGKGTAEARMGRERIVQNRERQDRVLKREIGDGRDRN